ncbi:MAG: ABC-F family ATP-binding cassette domain-containing protein [Eubacterium sp.]|nr:ABC-F family ATP-binding cassette domain-containing protein [Eubacterium sp.]
MILACNHIDQSFSEEIILKDTTFHINEHERVGIVGVNGAGKTTLLRIIVGELDADAGEVIRAKDTTLGYLPQQQGYHSDNTIYEELLAVKSDVIELDRDIRALEQKMAHAQGEELDKIMEQYNRLQTIFESGDGYTYKSKVLGVINGLGFGGDAMHQCINHLSGGQKTRVALGKLLLTEPDLLIMDEPTNHLDLESIRWLEGYLTGYKGSVLIVSHDRYFLDRIVNKVVEIDHAKTTVFTGNYSNYSEKKAAMREALIRQYYNQQQEIRHQEAVIEKLKSFNREKSIKRAESREKMLAKIERVEKPVEYEKTMSFTLTPSRISGNDVLKVEDFKKSFGEKHLFEHISFEIKRGEKIAVIGLNGTVNTTLLKMICGLESIDAGTVTPGANVEIGYYDQEHNVLHDEKTIFEEIQDDYPDLNHTEIRNVLAAFLFTGDDVFKPVKLLSGGEKGRVSLAKLMLSQANFLLLDEPTNHLDITSKEILETAIRNYTGTVLYVSHDRYFINRTATRILDLTGKKLLSYDGNYSYYLEKKDTMEQLHLDAAKDSVSAKSTSQSKRDWKAQKEFETKKRKVENAYKKAEALVEELENRMTAIDEEMLLPENATDVAKLTELSRERDEKEAALTDAMNEWEQLAQQLEEMTNSIG